MNSRAQYGCRLVSLSFEAMLPHFKILLKLYVFGINDDDDDDGENYHDYV